MGTKSPLFGTLENLETRISLSATPMATDPTLLAPILHDAVSQAARASQVATMESTSAGAMVGANATPYTGAAATILSSGKTVIEAENYDVGGEGVSYHDTDAANNGGVYRKDGVDIQACNEGGYNVGWVSPGEWMAYSINVQKAGTYDITVRVATTYSGSKFHFEFGPIGQTSGTGITRTATASVNSTGNWQSYTDITISGVQLQSGQQWMRFVSDDLYVNVNKFTVASTNTGANEGTVVSSTGTTTVAAADFDQGGEGVGYHDSDSANRGGAYRTTEGVDIEKCSEGGYDVSYVSAGDWTAYSLNVEKSGAYDVTVRVSANAASRMHLEVYQNGTWTTLPGVNFASTGGWQNWTDLKISGVQLQAGSAVVRLVADTQGFNYSKLSFTTTTVSNNTNVSAGTNVPATGTTSVNAVDYDQGGEGVGYHDYDSINRGGVYRTGEGVDIEKSSEGGYDVCYVNAGDWTAYTLNVAQNGTYNVSLRVAANAASKLHLEVFQNGAWTKLSSVSIASSGGWQKWTDVNLGGVSLSSGTVVVRLVADTEGFNYSKLSFTKQADPIPEPPAATKNFTSTVATVSGYQRLTITGSDGDDNITISKSNGVLTVTNGNYTETFSGNYGDIVVHGANGNDIITIQSSVNIATLLYGDAGNDTIKALGTGYNIVTTIGGGNDVVTGNGINTSFWADQAGTDTVNASSTEIAAGRVHQVTNFYQPWTTNTSSTDYITKELSGQRLRDPAGSGTNTYSGNSLWGTGPKIADINQGQISDCYVLADLQSAAQTSPDKLKEMVVDLGDGTYAVQFKRNGVTSYVRVDNDLGGGLYLNKADSGTWGLVIEKAYAFFRNGGNSYSSLNYGDTGAVARDMGYTVSYLSMSTQTASSLASAIQSAISSGVGLTVSTSTSIKLSAPVATSHAYSLIGTTTSSTGEILFQLRNPWGFDGYGSDGNASDGIVTLTMAQMQANFSSVMKMA